MNSIFKFTHGSVVSSQTVLAKQPERLTTGSDRVASPVNVPSKFFGRCAEKRLHELK